MSSEVLVAEASAVGVELELADADRLLTLCRLILEWPHNLTAIRDPGEMRRKHLVDSLACLPLAKLGEGEVVIDVGSGAGFPGIPIAVACPSTRVVLLDSVGKRVAFLEHASNVLGLVNVEVVKRRAEDLGRDTRWRERVDCVTARAVAPLRTLLELTLPLCRAGGRLVALKGADARPEIRNASGALQALGGRVGETRNLVLPGSEERRTIVRVDKVRATPGQYPRRSGVPEKRPL